MIRIWTARNDQCPVIWQDNQESEIQNFKRTNCNKKKNREGERLKETNLGKGDAVGRINNNKITSFSKLIESFLSVPTCLPRKQRNKLNINNLPNQIQNKHYKSTHSSVQV